mmetsp:Transcript_20546/g.33152  ORF Transcript_20546/g.33152 Transcript_20546/m.33152 type:complete len:205 (+) Transcript_20546:23-637(+)
MLPPLSSQKLTLFLGILWLQASQYYAFVLQDSPSSVTFLKLNHFVRPFTVLDNKTSYNLFVAQVSTSRDSEPDVGKLDLFELDVIEYIVLSSDEQNTTEATPQLGVVVDGSNKVQPLCCWQEGYDLDKEVEFLHDEDLEPIPIDQVGLKVLAVVASYPSQRQVGGGMGPSNPHGEESEDVFYIYPRDLSPNCKVVVRPELEIFW